VGFGKRKTTGKVLYSIFHFQAGIYNPAGFQHVSATGGVLPTGKWGKEI